MKFTVLSSGSKGNALLVQSGDTVLMVEAGLGPRVLKARLEQAGMAGLRPTALLITHNHYDHSRHAGQVAQAFNIPTWATPECAAAQLAAGAPFFAHRALSTRTGITVGNLTVRAFATPHDAPGSVGLVVEDGDSRLGVVTDLGCVPTHVVDALRDCGLLYAEFNHNVEMLRVGPYPMSLKRRCLSNVGHLSNEQGASLVGRSRTPLLRTLLLAHLSETNNTPGLALAAARTVVDGAGIHVQVAPQREVLGPLSVSAGRPKATVPAPGVTSVIKSAPALFDLAPVPRPQAARVGAPAKRPARVGVGPGAQLRLFATVE